MVENIDKIKKYRIDLDFNILVLIAFFSSRFLTKVLSLFFGVKGVFITMALLAVLYIVGIIIKIREKNYSFLFFFSMFFGLLFLTSLSYYFNEDIGYWLTDKEFGFLIKVFNVRDSISALLVILLVEDKKKIIKGLEYVAYINGIYLLAQILIFYKVGNWSNYFVTFEAKAGSSYNMNLGYDLIFVSFISLASYLKEPKKILLLVIGIVSMSYAIVFGSRGVLILIIAFVILYLMFFYREFKREKHYKSILIISISVLLLSFLLPKVNKYFNDLNVKKIENMTEAERKEYEEKFGEIDDSILENDDTSRTLEMIKQGDFFESNGRTKIWMDGLKAFKSSPIIGRGVFGDRPYVGERFNWGYSHNIAIELASNFGLIGIGLGFAIIYLIIVAFLKGDRDTKYLFLIFSAMLTKLLLSDSFYFSYIFWSIIALLYLTFFNNKNKIKINLWLSILFLLGTILGSALAIKRDYDNQDFNHIKFDSPTVAISITEYDEKYLDTILNELEKNKFKFSIFEDPINANYEKLLKKDVDLQDYKKESISYRIKPNDEILEDLDESSRIRKSFGKEESSALIAPYYAYSPSINYFLKDRKLFLIDYTNSLRTYSEITDSNRIYLRANQINIKETKIDEEKSLRDFELGKQEKFDEKLNQFEELILKIKENNSFAILDFKILDEGNLRLFRYALDSLNDNNIDTINFSDIEERVSSFGSDVNYRENMIKNSRFTYFIKKFIG